MKKEILKIKKSNKLSENFLNGLQNKFKDNFPIVQIFNYKVKSCPACPFFNNDGMSCNLDTDLVTTDLFDTVNSDCPFLQSLTKENIESLGFTYAYDINDLISCELDAYKFTLGEYSLYYYVKTTFIDIKHEEFYLLQNFHIANIEHLKFILRGFGIIYATK